MTKHYSNTAVQTSLSAGVNSVVTTLPVAATTGFPTAPFGLVIDEGTVNEELVLVTTAAGTNLTVTRGYDGTTAVAHDSGATVIHCHSAEDFSLSRAHEAATSGVHGVTGSLVGTSGAQVITNKDLTSPTNSFPTSLVTLTGAQSLTNKNLSISTSSITGFLPDIVPISDGSGKLVTSGKAIPTGSFVGTSDSQTLTNKTISVASNTVNGLAASSLVTTDGTGKMATTSKAIPTGTVVGTSDTQTLTNKTLTSPVLNTPTINGATVSSETIDNTSVTFSGGWTTFTPTASSGWGAVGRARYIKFGSFVFIDLMVTKGTGTLTANSVGNITDNPLLDTGIPAAIQPIRNTFLTFSSNGTMTGGWRVNADGSAHVCDMYPTAAISTGDIVTFSGFYALG